ncbi:hypothetical protein DVH05_013361 [Phytophthora capsici]|nr:hypothetical protein DVH05_013361 [Phytophthora capsici]
MRLLFFLAVLLATFATSCMSFSSAEKAAFIPKIDNGDRRLRQSVDIRPLSEKVASSVKSEKLADAVKTAAQLSDDQAAKIAKVLTTSDKARAAFLVSDDEIARMSTLIKKANAEAGVVDDEVANLGRLFAAAKRSAKATDDQVVAIAKVMANAKKADAVVKASDNDVRKVSDMFKFATGGATGAARYTDDEVAKLSKAIAEAQKGTDLTDKQVAKIVKLFTEAKLVSSLSNKQAEKLAKELAPVAVKDKKSWSVLKRLIVATLGVAGGAAIIYGVIKLTTPNEALAP